MIPADDESYNWDNEVFTMLAEARAKATHSRLKGYYTCACCHTDFIKAVARPKADCPFCGTVSERLMVMDDVLVRMTIEVWKADGMYSDVRADVARKEVSAS